MVRQLNDSDHVVTIGLLDLQTHQHSRFQFLCDWMNGIPLDIFFIAASGIDSIKLLFLQFSSQTEKKLDITLSKKINQAFYYNLLYSLGRLFFN